MAQLTPKLYGLVLAGGQSRRMNKDKAMLVYKDKPQLLLAYELLLSFCEEVFISKRRDQSLLLGQSIPFLEDHSPYESVGPIGGILSAMDVYPNAAWLVFACDLPFVTAETIEYLCQKRNTKMVATAYLSAHEEGLPEPLCAIYEPLAREKLILHFNSGKHCPRKFLINESKNVNLVKQQDKHSLDNINKPDEFEQAVKFLRGDKNEGN